MRYTMSVLLLITALAVATCGCCDVERIRMAMDGRRAGAEDVLVENRSGMSMPYNTLWKKNNKLVKVLDTLYDNLANTVEDSTNERKQMFSVMADSILQLMDHFSFNVDAKPDEFISRVIKNMINKAELPADVVANKPRRALSLLRAIIDKPINLVKKSCSPYTTNATCNILLEHYFKLETDKCRLYSHHENLYKQTIYLISNPTFDTFMEKLILASQRGTVEAAVAFMESAVQEYKAFLKDLYTWYNLFRSGDYPCRSLDTYTEDDFPPRRMATSYY